ncbi:MAG TPA: hypothetical protein VHZ74_10835 [Bryobacteraceae bacterium]|jgi:hypothetical protein|nr:hypothetical protein [Bryobacteraceae bacterium]
MYEPNDYPRTHETHAAAERAACDRAEAQLEARMEMFGAGRVSYGAARNGGEEYAIEMRESAAVDELVAEPVAAAINGWIRAVRIGTKVA